MSPEIALNLFRLIAKGPAVAVDGDGNVIREETKLETAMEMLGVQPYVPFSHVDNMYATNGRTRNVYMVEDQVAFLREWADALELLGPQGR